MAGRSTTWSGSTARPFSAIVVDDNTVALTLTPGEQAGNPVQAAVTPATPDFTVENDVTTSAAEMKSDLTLTREPGSNLVVVKGSLPAKSAPRKLVLAIEEPAQHAATLLKRLLEERGIKVSGSKLGDATSRGKWPGIRLFSRSTFPHH